MRFSQNIDIYYQITNMNYIFKSEHLDFENKNKNKNKNIQYYHWAQKKRAEKQKQQYQQFRKTWIDIEEEQGRQKLMKSALNQKSNDKKVTNIKPEELYNKNVQWKLQVEEKLQRKRYEKREQQQREIQLLRESKFKQPKLLRGLEHKGPVKAWKQRFDNYLRARSGEECNQGFENDFTPKIDKNSRRITKQMIGKVEDRLIEYGQKLKQKKNEMEIIYQEELMAQRTFMSSSKSIQSQISDVYYRLYKDGERINQKRNQQKSQYSFTPQINQYSQHIASRITQKRTPLHQSKVINQPQPQRQGKGKSSQKGFNDFLKRNDVLLSKIQKHKMKKLEIIREKQNKQTKQCTFTPVLNPKSLKMFATYHSGQSNQTSQPPLNFSKIENKQIDQETQKRKLIVNKSDLNELSLGKQVKSTQRMQRLHSDGNFNIFQNEASNIYIEEHDSISNLNESIKIKINQSYGSIKNTVVKYRSNDSLLYTDRLEMAPIYNIHEEMEEDSIERERDSDWEKELNMMELQIQAMMERTN